MQQGGTFVFEPGDTVQYEWRDRFPGDHAPLGDVLAAALPPRNRSGGQVERTRTDKV